jgi:hypothetical protein
VGGAQREQAQQLGQCRTSSTASTVVSHWGLGSQLPHTHHSTHSLHYSLDSRRTEGWRWTKAPYGHHRVHHRVHHRAPCKALRSATKGRQTQSRQNNPLPEQVGEGGVVTPGAHDGPKLVTRGALAWVQAVAGPSIHPKPTHHQ